MIKELMLKIKDIFINSLIPHHKFYKTILKKSLRQSYWYFFILIFTLNAIMFLIFALKINNRFNSNTFKQNINLLETLPKNLIININNGYLSSNQEKPILLWANNSNLIGVIDESATSEKIHLYDSKFLLTSSNLVIKTKDKGIINIPYSNTNIKITKDIILKLKTAILNLIPYAIGLISFYFLILSPIFIVIFLSIFLLLISLIAFLIYKSKIKKITYKKTFQISLHAITLPLIIFVGLISLNNLLLQILSAQIFLILSFAFILISLYDAYQ